MKTTILVALFAGIAVAVHDRDMEAFRPGKEYRFRVRSQSLSGIPHLAEQFSGIRFDTKVRLQLDRDHKATMRFEGVRFSRLNDTLHQLPVREIVADEKWQPVEPEQQRLYENCFKKPVIFQFDRGVIRNLEVPLEEAEWCANLKKGIVSLFQFDLSQQLERVDTDLVDILQWNRMNFEQNSDRAFRVMENAIDGECESLYIIQDSSESPSSFQVRKNRNYDNCRFLPMSEEGLFSDYVTDVQNPHNFTNFRSSSHTDGQMYGNREQFLIVHAKQVSAQVYTPLAEDEGEISTFSVQELTFLEAHDTKRATQPAVYTRPCPEGLKMILTKENLQPSEQQSSDKKAQIIDQLFTEYVSKCTPRVTEETLDVLGKLMYSLRECTAQDMIHVFKSISKEVEKSNGLESMEKKKMKTFLDVIPTVGRPDIITVLEYLIREQLVTSLQAATMINWIGLTVKPSALVATAFLPSSELYSYLDVQPSPQLRQAIILASGTVFHGLYKAQGNEPIDLSIYNNLIREYTKGMQDFYELAEDETEKIAILKAISNCGLPGFFDFLRQCIEEQNSIEVRVNAIMALRRMPQEMSLKIQNVLLPIFLDSREPQQVRVTAYVEIMKSWPNYGTVHSIMSSLYGEQSKQVGDFVYSHLQNIAESSRASLDETRQIVRVLMKEAEPFISRKYYRNTYSWDMLAREHGLGAYIDLFVSESTSTVFPTGLMGILGTTVYRREMEAIEAGMLFNGVEEIVSRLLGLKSFLKDLLSDDEQLSEELLDIIKQLLSPQRTPNMGKVDQFIQDLTQKLGQSQSNADQLDFMAYLRVLGNDLCFVNMEITDILEWIQQNKQKIFEQAITFVDHLKQGHEMNMMQTFASEVSIVVPNQLGIPVYVNQSYSHILGLDGAMVFTANLNPKPGVTFDANVKLSFGMRTHGSLGLQLPLLRAGVSVKNTVILHDDCHMALDLNDKLSARYFIPETSDVDLVHVETVPATYIHTLLSELTQEAFLCEKKEILNQQFSRPYKVTYLTEVFGQKFEHILEVPTALVSYAPNRALRHAYSLKRKEVTGTDQVIQLQFQLTDGNTENAQDPSERRNYRSLDVEGRKFDQVKEDPRIKVPVKKALMMNLMTERTPSSIESGSMVTFLRDQDSKKCQINVQVNGESYKAKCNIFADLHQIFSPSEDSKDSVDSVVFTMDMQYQAEDLEELSVSVGISTGDASSTVMIPAEPYYIYKLRDVFSLPLKTSSITRSSDGTNKDQLKSARRGLMPFPEFRDQAYIYNMDVKYEQVPEFLTQFIWQYYQELKDENKYDVAVTPKGRHEHPGRVNLVFSIKPNMERIHVLVDSSDDDSIFYCPARFPTYLHRALTFDSHLIFYDDNKEERNYEDMCPLTLETMVIKNQDIDGNDQTCITEDEVPKCPRGCKPIREESESKEVMCFPAYSQEARRLVQEVKYRPLNQIRHNGERKYREIRIPTQCQPDW